MIKVGTVTQFEEHEQQLFRDIMNAKGEDKASLIQKLIDQNLDSEAAIVQWMNRVGVFDIYNKLKHA